MRFECNDIVVFKAAGNETKSKISKVDGNVVKLFEENGSYRQMSRKDLERMVDNGFACIEKPADNDI